MLKLNSVTRVLLALMAAGFIAGCSMTDCPNCKEAERKLENQKPGKWNVVFYKSEKDPCTGKPITSVKTDLKPVYVPELEFERESCDAPIPFVDTLKNFKPGDNPKKLPGYLKILPVNCEAEMNVTTDNIIEITDMGTPLIPAQKNWTPDDPCLCCDRVRSGWWIFDKLELKAMLGFRMKPDSVYYPTATGKTIAYGPTFAGTDRGGSQLLYGFEMNLMWNLTFLYKK